MKTFAEISEQWPQFTCRDSGDNAAVDRINGASKFLSHLIPC